MRLGEKEKKRKTKNGVCEGFVLGNYRVRWTTNQICSGCWAWWGHRHTKRVRVQFLLRYLGSLGKTAHAYNAGLKWLRDRGKETGLVVLLWLGAEARVRVLLCKEGLLRFKSSTGAEGGSTEAFFSACPHVGHKGKWECELWKLIAVRHKQMESDRNQPERACHGQVCNNLSKKINNTVLNYNSQYKINVHNDINKWEIKE